MTDQPEAQAGEPVSPDPAAQPVPEQRLETPLEREIEHLEQMRLIQALRTPLTIKISRLPGFEDVPIPTYQHDGDAGMDLRAAFPEAKRSIGPGEHAMFPTGLKIEDFPFGFVLDVRSRSGKTWNLRLVVENAPGTIDAPYRGAISVIVANLNPRPDPKNPREPSGVIEVKRLEAIAQLVLLPVQLCRFEVVPSTATVDTTRGGGGFGSTGD